MPSEKKKQLVQKLTQQIQSYPVIALVNLENLPAKQLQTLRAQLLKKQILIAMARKRLLQLALKNSNKPNIQKLIEKIKGMPALLLSKENPFLLYQILQKNKSSAPARPNQTAPKDIIVPAGPTNFAPGPIISELASVGIKTKVESGKLTILEDTTVAKEGETISPQLAETLKRLDIQPMEIGLNLVAAWENNLVFDAKQLHIDEAGYLNNLTQAFQDSLSLALEIAYPTKQTIQPLLQKAFQQSKSLALEQNILTDLTAKELLSKAELQATSLKETTKIEIPKKKEEPKPPKPEEKPAPPEPKPLPTPPKPKPEEDIPTPEELIEATKKKFAKLEPEKREEIIEVKPSAEELVKKEKEKAQAEKPKKDKDIEEAESLYEKLKKKGTLRKEKNHN